MAEVEYLILKNCEYAEFEELADFLYTPDNISIPPLSSVYRKNLKIGIFTVIKSTSLYVNLPVKWKERLIHEWREL